MPLKLANNATSRLAGAIGSSSTTLTVTPGDGAKFPVLAAGDWFPLTIVKPDGTLEIVKCTSRSSDSFTVERGQEGTAAKDFAAGDRVELRATMAAWGEVQADAKQGVDDASTAKSTADAAKSTADSAKSTADSAKGVTDQIDFVFLYPNGGTAVAPANVASNGRYVMANPFPGKPVICVAEIQLAGVWGDPGWMFNSSTQSYGVRASQSSADGIVVQTGSNGLVSGGVAGGGSWLSPTLTTSAPCRVKVWKVKG